MINNMGLFGLYPEGSAPFIPSVEDVLKHTAGRSLGGKIETLPWRVDSPRPKYETLPGRTDGPPPVYKLF